MFKLLCAICICLAAVPALCQSTSEYQVGTITNVKPHQAAADAPSELRSAMTFGSRWRTQSLWSVHAARHEHGSVRWWA